MNNSSQILEKAIDKFASLPGVGRKTALKYAISILKKDDKDIVDFADAIRMLSEGIKTCKICGNVSDRDLCSICEDSKRNKNIICVVENIKDIISVEGTGQFNGFFHVLGGLISPMEGISPSDIRIEELIQRIKEEDVQEIILALGATVEGDTTSFYIYKKIIALKDIKISTLARGISVGNGLEYTDELSLARSIINRVDFKYN